MIRRALRTALIGAGLAGAAVLLSSLGAEDTVQLDLVDSTWRKSQVGVESLEAELRGGRVRRGRLVALFLDLNRVRPTIGLNPELASLDTLLEERGGFAIANAGYFTKERRPTGLLASGGEILYPFVAQAGGAGSGVLVVREGGVELLERDRVQTRDFADAELAIQAGPRVIEPDGTPGIRSNDGMRANRTVLGRDRRGRLVVVVTYAPEAGVGPTLFELQRLLGPEGLGQIHPDLALEAALNLDGGPSTGLHARAPAPRIDLPAASRVVSVLTLSRRAP